MPDIAAIKRLHDDLVGLASELEEQFKRLWERELLPEEVNVVHGFVLCRTQFHLRNVVLRIRAQHEASEADSELSMMADAVSEAREEVIRLVGASYRQWQIAADPADFPNLLAWETELARRLSLLRAIVVDFTFAKNALFARQTVAVAFGVPLGREFTWSELSALVCEATKAAPPAQVTVVGMSTLDTLLPVEAHWLKELLRILQGQHSGLQVFIVLHD